MRRRAAPAAGGGPPGVAASRVARASGSLVPAALFFLDPFAIAG
ncbi:MAG: hypothetical protein U0599_30065 [Vicinamibacteria bacterium]